MFLVQIWVLLRFYRINFNLFLSDNNPVDEIKAIISTSRYLANLLNIDKINEYDWEIPHLHTADHS